MTPEQMSKGRTIGYVIIIMGFMLILVGQIGAQISKHKNDFGLVEEAVPETVVLGPADLEICQVTVHKESLPELVSLGVFDWIKACETKARANIANSGWLSKS